MLVYIYIFFKKKKILTMNANTYLVKIQPSFNITIVLKFNAFLFHTKKNMSTCSSMWCEKNIYYQEIYYYLTDLVCNGRENFSFGKLFKYPFLMHLNTLNYYVMNACSLAAAVRIFLLFYIFKYQCCIILIWMDIGWGYLKMALHRFFFFFFTIKINNTIVKQHEWFIISSF